MPTPTLTIDPLREERTEALDAAKAVLARVKSLGRDLTPTEQTQIQAHLDRVNTLDKQIKGRALVGSVVGLGSAEDDTAIHGETWSKASLFNETDRAGIVHAAKSRTAYRADLNLKALTSGALLPTAGVTVEGGLHPTQFPIASLFPSQAAPGPSIRYYRTTAGTADIVEETELKPDAGVSFTAVDVLLTKLAARAEFSDEMADDAPFLVAHLQQELVAAVVAAENKLIVDTFAATSGVLTATGAVGTVVDMIADAVAAQESVSGATPAAILANPTVIASIRKSKASTSGVYNTDILSAGPTTLHGVRLVSSPAIPTANVWVVVPNGTTIFRRGGGSVQVGTSGDNFAMNMRTAIAEERLAVAVTRPSSLSKLVLT